MTKVAGTRAATDADFEFAWAVYAKAVKPLMEPHIARVRKEPWVDAEEKRRFSTLWNPAKSLVITCDGVPIGWLSVAESTECVHVENFYIDENYRNKGLGTAVLSWLVSSHKMRPFTTSFITGSPSHSLYERLGFAETEQLDFETKMQLTKAA
ncbi:MAG: GNAT family N-acetyltransferase [Methylocella sp.]